MSVDADLDRLDPYNGHDRLLSLIWRYGFLLGFVQSLMRESSWVEYQWQQHIDSKESD